MEEEQYIVDRIEENYVILENEAGNIINVKKNIINGNIKEGDILYIKDNTYFIDKEATKIRSQKINDLMKGLWEE